ncbi:hypothetical protein DITRI_Ditri02bG0157700 [Diplodiscus trichospermus]
MLLINSTAVPIPSPPVFLFQSSPYSTKLLVIPSNFIPWRCRRKLTSTRNTLIKVSSSLSLSSGNDEMEDVGPSQPQDAGEVVRGFYAGINSHDLTSVEPLIAEKCVYEDLILFPRPFIGRKALLEGYKSFIDSMSMDLQHVIEDITSTHHDSSTVGVTWHFEWKGKALPYSKGCSFYRLEMVDGKRQIVYGRDAAESSIKLGEAGLLVIKGVTWLLQQFPHLKDRL